MSLKPSIVFPQAEEFEEMFNNQLETVKGLQSDLAVASAENQVPWAGSIKLYGSVITTSKIHYLPKPLKKAVIMDPFVVL